eukprot:COSAG05_NODE_5425_length_1178_cov_1.053753_1_plen_49_part_00
MMAITGSVNVSFRIVVACRDSRVYTIKGQNTKAETNVCKLPPSPGSAH